MIFNPLNFFLLFTSISAVQELNKDFYNNLPSFYSKNLQNLGQDLNNEILLNDLTQNNNNNNYLEIRNADFPAKHDYFCTDSRAEWGCVFSVQTVIDAEKICDVDNKCKAFVIMPHMKKVGYFIAIFKNDVEGPVDHGGTTIFVKDGGSFQK